MRSRDDSAEDEDRKESAAKVPVKPVERSGECVKLLPHRVRSGFE
jgi:hypothetical protein